MTTSTSPQVSPPPQAPRRNEPPDAPGRVSVAWKHAVGGAGRALEALWRLRLGWIAGHALLVVTHVGRRTGKHRRTVLYVQRYDAHTREATVVSVWGESQWMRNIRRRPAAQIDIALQRYVPQQRFLTTEEIFEVEKRFRERHRVIAWGQAKLMGWPWPATDDELRALSAGLRGVAFRPLRDAAHAAQAESHPEQGTKESMRGRTSTLATAASRPRLTSTAR